MRTRIDPIGAGRRLSRDAIEFPPFRLDLRRGSLMRGDTILALRPKSWRVLCYLAERPRLLVSKRELLDAVWDGVVVGEDTLSKSISEIRAALGDDARAPRFLQTVHRRGFRFLGTVADKPSEHGAASGAKASHEVGSSCVGREDEIAELLGALGDASEGKRRLVFVTGEPGIGKTTLVDTFAGSIRDMADAGDVWVASGRTVGAVAQQEPFFPVLEALERLSRLIPEEQLSPLLRRVAPMWLVQLPWLLEPSDLHELRRSIGDARPEQMLRELGIFFEELTKNGTLVLVLEDLHWSDPATVDLVAMLAQRPEPANLLVVATFRPAELVVHDHPLSSALQQLRSRRQCTEIALPPLESAQVREYLDQRFPGSGFPAQLSAVLHEQTDGSPLFLTAVVDQLLGRGWVVETDQGWALTVPLDRLLIDVPEGLREVIRLQLEAILPSEREILESAAVAGVDFDLGIVAESAGVTIEIAESACMNLARRRSLLRRSAGPDGPHGVVERTYVFVHALCRQIVYEDIPEIRRRRLHGAVGAALEERCGNDSSELSAELAMHFRCAGNFEHAVAYLRDAAAVAALRFAPREAASCLESALDLLPSIADTGLRERLELEVRLALGAPLAAIHGFAADAVMDNCTQALALAESSAGSLDIYRALCGLWYSQGARAQVAAHETAERIVDLAEDLGSPALILQGKALLGRTAFHLGRVVEARDLLAAVLGGVDDPLAVTAEVGVLPYVGAGSYCAIALWHLGYADQGRRTMQRAREIAEEAGGPLTLVPSLLQEAYFEGLCGNHALVSELAQRGVGLASDQGLPFFRALGAALYHWAGIRLSGDLGALQSLREAIADFRATGATVWLPYLLGRLAEVLLLADLLDEARTAIDEGSELAHSTLDQLEAPELVRLRGELHRREIENGVARLSAETAEECFQRAMDLARDRSSTAIALRSATSLGALWLAEGRAADCSNLIGPYVDRMQEGFDTADVLAASALAERARFVAV